MEVLRDFQRRTETIYPIVRSVASVGIDTGFDGVHYTTPGHFKAAKSIAGILQKEVLGTSNSANVYSPNVKKIFYNADKTQIILKFNQGIDMIYPTDSTFLDINGFPVTSSMKNEIFINGVPSVVQSGSASKNYVFLNIPQSTSNQQITYIRNLDPISYTGVHLKTTLGERALTFARQTVVDGLSSPNASALLAMATSVSLQWSAVPQASFYHIERRTTGQPFIEVGTATNLTYLDQNLISNQTYDYRIWAENLSSESGVSNIASVSTTCNDNISVLSGGISANLIASNTVVLATQTQASNLNVAAGLSVTLLPGFSTQTGGTFVSEIRNCTN